MPLPALAGGGDGLGAQRLRARAVGRVVELDREAGLQARAEHGVAGALQRLLEPRDRLGVEPDDRDAEAGEAERGLAEQRGVAGAARELRRLGERFARRGGLAGAQQRVAAGEQDRAGLVLRVGERERVERAGEALGRVLVGEAVERAAARADEHLGGATGVGGLEQVGGDLLEVAVLAEPGERVRGAPVQPLAAQDVELVEHGLAHERVRELEAARRGGGLEQARAEDLVERGLLDVGLEAARWPAARSRPARGRGWPRRRAARWRRR